MLPNGLTRADQTISDTACKGPDSFGWPAGALDNDEFWPLGWDFPPSHPFLGVDRKRQDWLRESLFRKKDTGGRASGSTMVGDFKEALLGEGLRGIISGHRQLSDGDHGPKYKKDPGPGEEDYEPPDSSKDPPRTGSGCSFTCSTGNIQITTPRDQDLLGAVCTLNLGPCADPLLVWMFPNGLTRTLTSDEATALDCEPAVAEKQDVFDTLLPTFQDALHDASLTETQAQALVDVPTWSYSTGLYFGNLFGESVALCVRAVFSHARYLDDVGEDGIFSTKCKSSYRQSTRALSGLYTNALRARPEAVDRFMGC